MTFAKLAFLVGAATFVFAALGFGGAWVIAVGSVTLLSAAIAGAVALEEREAVEGLVVHDLAPAEISEAATVGEVTEAA